jgi:Phage tail assembly chaperone protein, TAC
MEIAGITYQVGKLNAFEQLHVARRLAPMFGALVSVFAAAPKGLEEGGSEEGESVESKILELAMGPLADTFAKMSNEDVDFIVNTCLSACQRKQERGWAKVFVNGHLMFQDIQLDTLLGLTFAVLQENLGSFFPTSQPTSDTQK